MWFCNDFFWLNKLLSLLSLIVSCQPNNQVVYLLNTNLKKSLVEDLLVKQFFLTTLFYTTPHHSQEIKFVKQLIFLVLILSKPTLQLSTNDFYLVALVFLMVFTCFKNCKNACTLNNLLNNYWQHPNTLEPINKQTNK